MNKKKWIVVGLVAMLGVIAFLLFRPDTLFTQVRADETLADAFTSETTAPPTPDVAITPSTTEIEEEPAATTEPTSPLESGEPQALSSGEFSGIDHTAEGTATIYEQDGRFVLRFEDDTNIQNGPDLYVWLLPTETYEGGDPSEFTDLGTLKGTTGGQNYELPADFDPEGPWTVLVWCLRFAVPFAAAELA
jgi:hypothetical protein